MFTCSNCGALYPPDDRECPECGIENDRSGLPSRVDSPSNDSDADKVIANRDSGSAVDRERTANERRSDRENGSARTPETETVKKLEETIPTELAESDVPETINRGPISSFGEEIERSQKPISRDEDPTAIPEPRAAGDRDTDYRENAGGESAESDESERATQHDVLPPAYGSVALAAAAEMERAASEEQSLGFPDESEPLTSQSDPDAHEDNEATIAQAGRDRESEQPRAASTSDSVSHPEDEMQQEESIPVCPPVLASEALREQLAPAEPGRGTIRVLLFVVGFSGALSMLALLGTSGMGFPLAGAFLALTAFALPSIPYAPRAAAVFTISASTLGVVTWMYLGTAGTPAEVVETIGVVTLGIALQFRAWHRASIAARFLVAVGILVCMGWLGMSGWLKDFATLDPAWQSWLPTILRAPFGLLLVLSLLAFMDARTTGGCGIWATAILLWHALYLTVQLMILVWPRESRVPNWQLLSGDLSTITAASIASPLLATLVIFGVAQLLAVAFTVDVRAKQ